MTDDQFKQLMDKLEEIKTVAILTNRQNVVTSSPCRWDDKVDALNKIEDEIKKLEDK